MEYLIDGDKIEGLIAELYEKKRWLDVLIEGLESAAESPQHRLIATASEAFSGAARRRPKVDLEAASRKKLARLAKSVRGRRPEAVLAASALVAE